MSNADYQLTTAELDDATSKLKEAMYRASESLFDMCRIMCDICERQLWKSKYASQEEYAKEEFGRSARWMRQVASLLPVLEAAKRVGGELPNYRQAIALASVPEEDIEHVWEEASSNGDPTAESVKLAKRTIAHRKKHKTVTKAEEVEDDDEGDEEPCADEDVVAAASEIFNSILSNYDAAIREARAIRMSKVSGYLDLVWNQYETLHKNLRATVAGCGPHCLCEACDGDGCASCGSTGFLNKATARNTL